MMNIEQLKERILKVTSSRAHDTLCELENYVGSTFNDDDALLQAIKTDSDELQDTIHEIANGRPSVYYADQLEWLSNNLRRADQEEAIACGAKSAQEIAAFCWVMCEKDDIREDIETMCEILLNDQDKELA